MSDNSAKLPVSAMLVGYNEAHLLGACLASLSFCKEIVYTDLGSEDNSVEIAKQFTDLIYYQNRDNVPSGEIAQSIMIKQTNHEWVVFIDPDEVADPSLVEQIRNSFSEITKNTETGAVLVPWQFYFRRKMLKGTVWGGDNKKYFLVHKDRFDFLPVTHYGRKLRSGYKNYEIKKNKNGTNILHHYWMSGFRIFLQKHKRYLRKEGRDNYNLGVRMSFKKMILSPFTEFSNSFFRLKGYKDGFTGFLLSCFWAYYRTYIATDIRHIQKTALSFYEEKQQMNIKARS